VAQVARRVAEGLHEHRGEPVDVGLVEAAALLHDIAKALCFETHLDHAAEGGRILRGLGLEAVATLVERHVILGAWDPEGVVTEAEIVNYADKRVRNDQVVSLTERFDDLIVRYGARPEIEARIRGNWAVMAAVEAKIFARLPFTPAEVRPRRPARGPR
jgi:putative nucleotidyltransferase with HDIG domain